MKINKASPLNEAAVVRMVAVRLAKFASSLLTKRITCVLMEPPKICRGTRVLVPGYEGMPGYEGISAEVRGYAGVRGVQGYEGMPGCEGISAEVRGYAGVY